MKALNEFLNESMSYNNLVPSLEKELKKTGVEKRNEHRPGKAKFSEKAQLTCDQ